MQVASMALNDPAEAHPCAIFSIRHDGFVVQENLSQFFESLQALRTVDYSGAIFCISQSPKLRPEAKL